MSDECKYYYYDSGYCCSLKREHYGSSSVDSDDVKRYCWGYHYEGCPTYKQYGTYSSGGCFLTSACTEARGLPDDCEELQTLRGFRDSYLRAQPKGAEEILEYYRVAPRIVEEINKRPDKLEVYDRIYRELVTPCVEWIKDGALDRAHNAYREYTTSLQLEHIG